MQSRILIAGVGNIFLGDDAFGVEVVKQMAARPLPSCVEVVDFGIRGLDLAYALLENYDSAILVDAMPRGAAPGTLFLLEPEISAIRDGQPQYGVPIETHGMDPVKVLWLAAAMGGMPRRVLVVGCEPEGFDPETDMDMDLSRPVRAAIAPAIDLIESTVAKLLLDIERTQGDSKGAIDHDAPHPSFIGPGLHAEPSGPGMDRPRHS